MSDLIHDLGAALTAAVVAATNEWRRLRWLRQGGNPDDCPF